MLAQLQKPLPSAHCTLTLSPPFGVCARARLLTFRSGHLTSRWRRVGRGERPFHSLYLANFTSVSQSVTESVSSSHFRAAIAISLFPPARPCICLPRHEMGLEREQEAAVDPQLGGGGEGSDVGRGRMGEGSVGNPAGRDGASTKFSD